MEKVGRLNNTKILVIILVVLIFLSGMTIFFLVKTSTSKTERESSQNIPVDNKGEVSITKSKGYDRSTKYDDIYTQIDSTDNVDEQKRMINEFFLQKMELAYDDSEKVGVLSAQVRALASIEAYDEAKDKLLEAYSYKKEDELAKNDLCDAIFVFVSGTGDTVWANEYEHNCFGAEDD